MCKMDVLGFARFDVQGIRHSRRSTQLPCDHTLAVGSGEETGTLAYSRAVSVLGRGYSSVVEHMLCMQNVPSSVPTFFSIAGAWKVKYDIIVSKSWGGGILNIFSL